MHKRIILILVLQAFIFSAAWSSIVRDSLNVAPFGKVFIYKPQGTPSKVAIMISGDGGWKYGVIGFSERFAEHNVLVIGVDILTYFRDLRQRKDDCYNVSADFVNLATVIEKQYNFPDYKPALLMGYSSGATLVYGILAQSRPGTFMGGISLGFCPDIELPKMLCQVNGLTEKPGPDGKSFFLQPDAKLGNPWIVMQGKLDKVCNYDETAIFVNGTSGAELVTLPKVGHGFAKLIDFMPEWIDAYDRLVKKFEGSQKQNVSTGQLPDLPLVITEAKIRNDEGPIALIISGDGGWYWFEQSIADHLAGIGISSVGLDSKKYFWNRKTPEECASDLEKTLKYYGTKWGRNKFVLIGYSLGAEIVPFITTRFDDEFRQNLSSTVLLSPDVTTDFEIHITNMLGMGNKQNTYSVADEISRIKNCLVLVIFGEAEKPRLPEQLAGKPVTIKFIPGDHHYKFNVSLIIKVMQDAKAI